MVEACFLALGRWGAGAQRHLAGASDRAGDTIRHLRLPEIQRVARISPICT